MHDFISPCYNYQIDQFRLWLMPNAMLKGMVMNGLIEEDGNMDIAIAKACEFMQEKLDSLGQSDLASRLTLNCTPSFVQPHLVNDLPVTILDVWDDCALSQQVSINWPWKFMPQINVENVYCQINSCQIFFYYFR